MTTATLTQADVRVRDAVMRQLDWDPEVDGSAVGVAARTGTVTLTYLKQFMRFENYAPDASFGPGV